MKSSCAAIRQHLGAYADGELASPKRHRVAHHLVSCGTCNDALEEIRAIGDLLRAESAAPVPQLELAAVTSGVVSRVRAEQAQSWRALMRRATGDWHYALTGAGALAAAVMSIVFLSAICRVVPGRGGDSLALVLEKLERPAGQLFIRATPVGPHQVPMWMRVIDDGAPLGSVADRELQPLDLYGPSEGDLAVALSDSVIRADGRVRDLRSMPKAARVETEEQLYKIQLAQWAQRQPIPLVRPRSAQTMVIQGLAFKTGMRVTGKSL
jgi:hypothetical protein